MVLISLVVGQQKRNARPYPTKEETNMSYFRTLVRNSFVDRELLTDGMIVMLCYDKAELSNNLMLE